MGDDGAVSLERGGGQANVAGRHISRAQACCCGRNAWSKRRIGPFRLSVSVLPDRLQKQPRSLATHPRL